MDTEDTWVLLLADIQNFQNMIGIGQKMYLDQYQNIDYSRFDFHNFVACLAGAEGLIVRRADEALVRTECRREVLVMGWVKHHRMDLTH